MSPSTNRRVWLSLPRAATIVCGALVMLAVTSVEAQAQRRVPLFQRQPTVSPYLQLMGGTNQGWNNYFFFVRPQRQFQRFVDQQLLHEAQVEQTLMGLRTGAIQPGYAGQPLGAAPGVIQQRPASVGQSQPRQAAVFNNLGGFYPPRTPAIGPRVLQPLSQ